MVPAGGSSPPPPDASLPGARFPVRAVSILRQDRATAIGTDRPRPTRLGLADMSAGTTGRSRFDSSGSRSLTATGNAKAGALGPYIGRLCPSPDSRETRSTAATRTTEPSDASTSHRPATQRHGHPQGLPDRKVERGGVAVRQPLQGAGTSKRERPASGRYSSQRRKTRVPPAARPPPAWPRATGPSPNGSGRPRLPAATASAGTSTSPRSNSRRRGGPAATPR